MGYKVWGLFLHGKLLVAQYEYTNKGYQEAMEDAEFAFEETGVPHTVQEHTVKD